MHLNFYEALAHLRVQTKLCSLATHDEVAEGDKGSAGAGAVHVPPELSVEAFIVHFGREDKKC